MLRPWRNQIMSRCPKAIGVLLVCAAVAGGVACKKKASGQDWETWKAHYDALEQEATKRVGTCNAKDPSSFAPFVAGHASDVRSGLSNIDRDAAPKPERVTCFLQAKTCEAVAACKTTDDEARTELDKMIDDAKSNCQMAANLCQQK
jgi:hypothetical protein